MRGAIQVSQTTLMIVALSVCAIAQPAGPGMGNQLGAGYILGPDDQIVIRVLDAEEISEKPVLVDTDGYIKLPLIDRVRAGGLTTAELESEIASRLKVYLQQPQVAVSIIEFRSQPVSVLGAVTNAGVVQLRGRKTLFEVISAAGGLRTEAGNSIKITRRKEFGPIPLPSAANDATGLFSVAEVSVKSVMEARNPQENIEIKPNDVISVPRAEMVYVIGAVRRPGGFVLNEREQISVLEVLSMAEGLDRLAAGKNAKILRSSEATSNRVEIAVDVNRILAGKARDVPMSANDILFIPNSATKSASLRSLEAAIQLGTGLAIWRR